MAPTPIALLLAVMLLLGTHSAQAQTTNWLSNLGNLLGVRSASIGTFQFGNGANGVGSAAQAVYPGNTYSSGPVGVVDTTSGTQALVAGSKAASAGGWFNKAITPKASTGGLFVAGTSTLDAKYKGTTVMETPEKTYQYSQVTVIQKQEVIRKKGYCIPRVAAQLNDAFASGCPANTYLVNQNVNSNGQYVNRQICTRSDCSGQWNSKKAGLFATTTGSVGADYTTAGGAGTVKGSGYSEGAVQCQTIFVKPILACPQYCITDFRSYGDKCLCPNGWMTCPMKYQTCNCNSNNVNFQLCVADSYWCNYYCQYLDVWGQYTQSKGANLCPLDPDQLDPYFPPSLYPKLLSLDAVAANGK